MPLSRVDRALATYLLIAALLLLVWKVVEIGMVLADPERAMTFFEFPMTRSATVTYHVAGVILAGLTAVAARGILCRDDAGFAIVCGVTAVLMVTDAYSHERFSVAMIWGALALAVLLSMAATRARVVQALVVLLLLPLVIDAPASYMVRVVLLRDAPFVYFVLRLVQGMQPAVSAPLAESDLKVPAGM